MLLVVSAALAATDEDTVRQNGAGAALLVTHAGAYVLGKGYFCRLRGSSHPSQSPLPTWASRALRVS
jgi:hypothetical protein